MKRAGLQKRDGVSIYDISFASPVDNRRTSVGPNGGVVTAYLVVPPGSGPFPAVIYGHWCMPGSEKKNRTEFLDEAIVLAHSGVVCLLPGHVIVHPGFVQDNTPLNDQQIAVEVQQNVNLRRGADLLLARGDVDRERLAYVGHSCDASAGGFLSGIDQCLRPLSSWRATCRSRSMRKRNRYRNIGRRLDRKNSMPLPPGIPGWTGENTSLTQHLRPCFCSTQVMNRFLNGDMAKQYFEIVSEPKKLKVYEAPHALNAEATRDRIAFLAEKLSFTPPDAEVVNAIPVLVQPRWPKSN